MKIDPVTYEVDMSAGTHPLYVWEAPVRVWHWAMRSEEHTSELQSPR